MGSHVGTSDDVDELKQRLIETWQQSKESFIKRDCWTDRSFYACVEGKHLDICLATPYF